MPSRKQRRRRAKDRRHEYEYVYVDEKARDRGRRGRAAQPERLRPEAAKAKRRRKDKPIQAGRRVVQPPSWRRAPAAGSSSRRDRGVRLLPEPQPAALRRRAERAHPARVLHPVRLPDGPRHVPRVLRASSSARAEPPREEPPSALARRGSGPRRATARAAAGCGRRPRLATECRSRLEAEERARPGLDASRRRPSTCDAPVDDRQPGVLLDLVVAELLARVEHDQHRARLVRRVEDDRDARAVRRVEARGGPRPASRRSYPGLDGSSTPLHSPDREPRRRPLRARPDRDELLRRPRVARRARGGRDRSGRRRHRPAARARALGARCAAILITHTHFDHIGGIADLAEATGAPVYVSEIEAFVLERPDDVYAAYGVHVRPWSAEHRLQGDETFELGGHRRGRRSPSPATRPATSPSPPTARSSPATCSSPARSAASTCPAATGRRCSTRSACSPSASRRRRSSTPGHGQPTTLGAELERNPFLAELRAAR